MHAGARNGCVCTGNVLCLNDPRNFVIPPSGPYCSVSEAFWMTDFGFIGSEYYRNDPINGISAALEQELYECVSVHKKLKELIWGEYVSSRVSIEDWVKHKE
jgi:hypothetical protein